MFIIFIYLIQCFKEMYNILKFQKYICNKRQIFFITFPLFYCFEVNFVVVVATAVPAAAQFVPCRSTVRWNDVAIVIKRRTLWADLTLYDTQCGWLKPFYKYSYMICTSNMHRNLVLQYKSIRIFWIKEYHCRYMKNRYIARPVLYRRMRWIDTDADIA